MLSIRTITRVPIRSVAWAAGSRSALVKQVTGVDLIWKSKRIPIAAMSTRSANLPKSQDGDGELVSKLKEEIRFEKNITEDSAEPVSIKDYLKNGPFTISDTPGKDEVIMDRKFGSEKIQVSFSTSDLNMDPDPDMTDRAFNGEEEEGEANPDEQKLGEENSEEEPNSPALRLNIVVEKPAKGALVFDTVIQDGVIIIDSCFHFADATHAYAKTPDKLHERQELYLGPPFANLDEGVQVLFERYLDERGINNSLAVFINEYIGLKEQKEYQRWLENIKSFVEA